MRILQTFLNSILLLAVISVGVEMIASHNWSILLMGIILFLAALATLLLGSIALNVTILKNNVFKFSIPSKLKPQFLILIGSIVLLYLISTQVVRIGTYFDSHLSTYYLTFHLPPDFEARRSWAYDGISISGNGSQMMVTFLYILAINIMIALHNAGLLQTILTKNLGANMKTFIIAHIGAGLLTIAAGTIVFIAFINEVQSFIGLLRFDQLVTTSSNVSRLVYDFINITIVLIWGQWNFRDGIRLYRANSIS